MAWRRLEVGGGALHSHPAFENVRKEKCSVFRMGRSFQTVCNIHNGFYPRTVVALLFLLSLRLSAASLLSQWLNTEMYSKFKRVRSICVTCFRFRSYVFINILSDGKFKLSSGNHEILCIADLNFAMKHIGIPLKFTLKN